MNPDTRAEDGRPPELHPGSDAAALSPAPARRHPTLEDVFRREPTSFAFFQAVRLLSQLWPERATVGRWANPADEVVRFSASTSLGFPASEIQTLDLERKEPRGKEPRPRTANTGVMAAHRTRAPAQMMVNFFGLTGPQGVLPHVYTEYAAARSRAKDTGFRDFLDLFQHRAISLFYRAWEKHRSVVVQEMGTEDRLRDHLLDLAGLGTEGLHGRLPVSDDALAFYAGLSAPRGRTADGLARLIGDYFDVPASVEQFAGAWRRVDETGQCTLGGDGEAGQLGFGVIGDVAWDPHNGIKLRLGPLTRAQFNAFLPDGPAHEPLRALTRFYIDDQVSVDAQLILARDEVEPCTLLPPAMAASAGAPALGRGTWLSSKPLARDPDETTLRLCD